MPDEPTGLPEGLPSLADAMKSVAPEPAAPAADEPVRTQEPSTKEPEKEPAKPKVDEPERSALDADDTPENEPAKEPEGEQRKDESTSAWKKRVKSELAAAKNEAAQARAEIEKLKSRPGTEDSAKVAALEAELKEYREQLEITAFERSPKFKTEFANPIAELTASIRESISEIADEDGVADKALQLKGKARLDFLKETIGDSGSAFLIHEKMKGLEALQAKRDAAVTDANKRAEAFAKPEDKTVEHVAAFKEILPEVQAKISALRPIDGDTEHNAKVESALKLAEAIISGEASDRDILRAPYLAVAAPIYIAQNKALQKDNAALKERIAKYEKATPEPKGKGADGEKSGPVSFKPPTLKELEDRLTQVAG